MNPTVSPIADHSSSNFLDDSILFNNHGHMNRKVKSGFADDLSSIRPQSDNMNNFLNENVSPQEPLSNIEQPKDNIIRVLKSTNSTLSSFGFPQIGDLTSNQNDEIEKTLNCIHELIQQRLKDIEFRKEVFERIAKLQHDKSMYIQTVERIKQENHNLSKEIGGLKNQFLRVEKKHKEEREKLSSEKDLLSKSLAKQNQKISQYQHDLRKKEVDVSKVKEQILKKAVTTNSRHAAELLTPAGCDIFKAKQVAENDLTSMVSYNVDTYKNRLLLENQELRSLLCSLQRDLVSIVSEKKEEFIQRRISEANRNTEVRNIRNYYDVYFADVQLANIKEGMFNMPLEKVGDSIVQSLGQNMNTLGYFIDKLLKFNYNSDLFKNLTTDLSGVDQELSRMNQIVDAKKVLEDWKYQDEKTFPPQSKKDLSLALEPKKDILSRFDQIESNISHRHSPIGQMKEFDISLCKELLDELPKTATRDIPSTNDVENNFNDFFNAKERLRKEEEALSKDKPILQDSNKWKNNYQNFRASFGCQ